MKNTGNDGDQGAGGVKRPAEPDQPPTNDPDAE